MQIDAKTILYDTIAKMGKQRIESEIISTPSNVPKTIRDIFSRTMSALQEYGHYEEKVLSDLVAALMHYLLSICLIQADRKVEFATGLTLDIVIPSAKQLKTDSKRTLLLAFPEKIDRTSIDARTSALQKVQHDKEKIWLIFGHYNDELASICKDFRTYVPDEFTKGSLRPLSSVIDDIKLFVEVNKIKSFKIFPT
jgi:hypothetical protein